MGAATATARRKDRARQPKQPRDAPAQALRLLLLLLLLLVLLLLPLREGRQREGVPLLVWVRGQRLVGVRTRGGGGVRKRRRNVPFPLDVLPALAFGIRGHAVAVATAAAAAIVVVVLVVAAAAVAATSSVAALLCSLPRCLLLVHSPLRQAVAVVVEVKGRLLRSPAAK